MRQFKVFLTNILIVLIAMKIIRIRIVVIKSENFPRIWFQHNLIENFRDCCLGSLLPAVVCACLKWAVPFNFSFIWYCMEISQTRWLRAVSCLNRGEPSCPSPVIGECSFVQLQRSNKLRRWWKRSGWSYCLMSWMHLQLERIARSLQIWCDD